MTKRYITRGVVMDYANTSGAQINSGAMIVIGTKVGVALADIPNNTTGSVQMAGVFDVPKLATDVVAQGAALYWDNVNSRLTVTAAGNTLAGYAYAAAGNGAASVQIVLNGVPG